MPLPAFIFSLSVDDTSTVLLVRTTPTHPVAEVTCPELHAEASAPPAYRARYHPSTAVSPRTLLDMLQEVEALFTAGLPERPVTAIDSQLIPLGMHLAQILFQGLSAPDRETLEDPCTLIIALPAPERQSTPLRRERAELLHRLPWTLLAPNGTFAVPFHAVRVTGTSLARVSVALQDPSCLFFGETSRQLGGHLELFLRQLEALWWGESLGVTLPDGRSRLRIWENPELPLELSDRNQCAELLIYVGQARGTTQAPALSLGPRAKTDPSLTPDDLSVDALATALKKSNKVRLLHLQLEDMPDVRWLLAVLKKLEPTVAALTWAAGLGTLVQKGRVLPLALEAHPVLGFLQTLYRKGLPPGQALAYAWLEGHAARDTDTHTKDLLLARWGSRGQYAASPTDGWSLTVKAPSPRQLRTQVLLELDRKAQLSVCDKWLPQAHKQGWSGLGLLWMGTQDQGPFHLHSRIEPILRTYWSSDPASGSTERGRVLIKEVRVPRLLTLPPDYLRESLRDAFAFSLTLPGGKWRPAQVETFQERTLKAHRLDRLVVYFFQVYELESLTSLSGQGEPPRPSWLETLIAFWKEEVFPLATKGVTFVCAASLEVPGGAGVTPALDARVKALGVHVRAQGLHPVRPSPRTGVLVLEPLQQVNAQDLETFFTDIGIPEVYIGREEQLIQDCLRLQGPSGNGRVDWEKVKDFLLTFRDAWTQLQEIEDDDDAL